MGFKKPKSTGKRKITKTSVTKLSNKRLNKLAKQGKLKKVLPHGKYVQLLHQRLKSRPGKNQSPSDVTLPDALRTKRKDEKDIPLEEADYEYYSKPGRDFSFLNEIRQKQKGEKRRKKKKTGDDEEDYDVIETEYAERKQGEPPKKRMRALLPIKGEQGIVQRMEEVQDEESEEESDAEVHVDKKYVKEKGEEEVPRRPLTAVEVLKLRQDLLASRKQKIALLCSAIIENPELNTSKLKELRNMLYEKIQHVSVTVRKLVMVSLMEIFKDILPAYRIRNTTDQEKLQSMKQDTKKLREFEGTLLNHYKRYLEFVESVIKPKKKKRDNGVVPDESKKKLTYIGVQCLCELLVTHPNFNFRTNIISLVIPFVSGNVQVSDLVCDYIKRIFKEDKTGEVTLEVVRLIGRIIKARNFYVKPRVLDTFLSLRIKDVDYLQKTDSKKKKNQPTSRKERKRNKQMIGLEKELADAAAVSDKSHKLKVNTETIKMVFLTYFRILKKAEHSVLLSSVLEGLAKFAHLISIDFFDDLFATLNRLVDAEHLTYRESLHCVKTAFTILSGQGAALNIDPINFYRHLYSRLLDLHTGIPHQDIPVALDCLDIMINKRKRQISHSRMLAFIKRLSTLALHLNSHGALAILSMMRSFIHADQMSDMLYETEGHGSGLFMPELEDPEHCNANNTAVFELYVLKNHYHPSVCQYAQHLLAGAPSQGGRQLAVHFSRRTARELFEDYDASDMKLTPTMQQKPQGKLCKISKDGQFLQKEMEDCVSRVTTSSSQCDELDFSSICWSNKEKKANRVVKEELITSS